MSGRNFCALLLLSFVFMQPELSSAERKRGEAGSDERSLWCGSRLRDCLRDSQESCRGGHSNSGDIFDCYETTRKVCERSWGPGSDCNTLPIGSGRALRLQGGALEASEAAPRPSGPPKPSAPKRPSTVR